MGQEAYLTFFNNAFDSNTLTTQELQAAHLAQYDLGPGYPQVEVPDYVRRLYLGDSIEDLSLRFAPVWSPEKQARVDFDLNSSVKIFLGISKKFQGEIKVTFSGSIALERVITSILNLAYKSGASELHVVTTTPCIDIMKLFLEERKNVVPIFVPSNFNGKLGALDTNALISAIQSAGIGNPKRFVAVLLTSPENPTGAVWSSQDLKEISCICEKTGAVLIVDHCFAVAGLHDSVHLARVWDIDAPCDWIAVWDTGKTFGLNEDKLGFIICGNKKIQKAVDESLAVLQFGVARRSKMFFTELLRRAYFFDHISELRKLCQTNLGIAIDRSGELFSVVTPIAGSLLLLDISILKRTDELIRRQLLDSGIGVIAGNVFFHTDWKPETYIRVALARHSDYFSAAIDRLIRVLK